MAEEARLESVYTSKAYPGFESRSLRNPPNAKSLIHNESATFLLQVSPRFWIFGDTWGRKMAFFVYFLAT